MKKILFFTAMILCAVPAMADTNQNNGSGNVIENNSHNNSGNSYDHSGNVTAKGGSAHSSSSSYSGSSSHSSAKQNQSANNNGNSQGVSINNPRSAASAAPTFLTSAGDCVGSTGGGVSFPGFGVNLGSTSSAGMDGCNRRHNAMLLWNMQKKNAALAVLCQDSDVAKAMQVAGTPCPGTEANLAPSAGAEAYVTSASHVEYNYPTGFRH